MKTHCEFTTHLPKGGNPALPARSLFACAVMLAASAFATADVKLKGTVGARVINDDVIIARGVTCILNGTTIKGNVRVRSGAKLYMNGAWVDGSIYANHSMLVDLRGSSRVTWNVRGNGTRSVMLRNGSQIGGHVRLKDGSAPSNVDALFLRNASVVGDVLAQNSKGRMRVMNSMIEGNLLVTENRRGRFAIHDNEVWKNLKFISNTGTGAILENNVGGNLVSRENTPAPRVEQNVVRGFVRIQ